MYRWTSLPGLWCLQGTSGTAVAAAGAPSPTGGVVIDQSILDDSQAMLTHLQNENAKLRSENGELHGKMTRMDREMSHLRNSADTSESTMKLLSQHAKALAQAHMKLQSEKEKVDQQLEKAVLKVSAPRPNHLTQHP